MVAFLLFCHGVLTGPGAASWWWLLPSAAVGAGFFISLARLLREMKGD